MATSGTTSYLLTASGIVQKAFELLEVYAPGESVSGEDFNSAMVSLNMMIKHWQAERKLYLHQVEEATLFLAAGQRTYKIGNSSTDKVGLSVNVVETQLTEAEIITDTLMHVNSTTGMLATDIIGVVMNDSTILWTTIASVTSSTSVTLTAALTVAAASGNYVFSYRTAAGRPLDIDICMLRQAGGTDTTLSQYISEIPMTAVSQSTYFRYPNKGTQGTPLQYYIEKKNLYSNINVFPVPTTPNYRVKFLYKRIIENFDSSSNNPDIPQEYGAALVYNLAAAIAPQYNRMEKLQYFEAKGNELLDGAASTSQENNVSLIIRPK